MGSRHAEERHPDKRRRRGGVARVHGSDGESLDDVGDLVALGALVSLRES